MNESKPKHTPGPLDGTGRQPCSRPGCSYRSLAGLMREAGECPYHWAERIWGTRWASKCHPDHPDVARRAALAKAEGRS